jgi:hypothetical protein
LRPRGSFATVKRATSLADGKEWAVKIIDKTKLDADDEAALKVEVEILNTVRRQSVSPSSRHPPPPLGTPTGCKWCCTPADARAAAVHCELDPASCLRAPPGEGKEKTVLKTRLGCAACLPLLPMCGQVDHPNIVQLHQIFDCPKVFYMVRSQAR